MAAIAKIYNAFLIVVSFEKDVKTCCQTYWTPHRFDGWYGDYGQLITVRNTTDVTYVQKTYTALFNVTSLVLCTGVGSSGNYGFSGSRTCQPPNQQAQLVTLLKVSCHQVHLRIAKLRLAGKTPEKCICNPRYHRLYYACGQFHYAS